MSLQKIVLGVTDGNFVIIYQKYTYIYIYDNRSNEVSGYLVLNLETIFCKSANNKYIVVLGREILSFFWISMINGCQVVRSDDSVAGVLPYHSASILK